MDAKLQEGLYRALASLKEPIPSLLASSKQSGSEEEKKKRFDEMISDIPRKMKSFGIPPRFISMEFKTELSINLIKTGACLIGKVGVGKTMAVCLLVKEWLIKRVDLSVKRLWDPDYFNCGWRFISFPEFMMTVQDSFRHGHGEVTALDLLQEIANEKYLILDDLGAEKPTEYVRQATYYLINHREMNLLPTFITTNFSMDHLDENLDSRISSRIAGMCEIIRIEGNDRRIQKK